MNFEVEDRRSPFRPDNQIQPCSIDLRLDKSFWEPQKPGWRTSIDFRNTAQGELMIRRLFPARRLRTGEGITIKPGHMLLGRTFEKFTVPNGYTARLKGRSTFARLGLSINCTGDFINPGWRGRMPLQLVNHGLVPITVVPLLPICQLVVMRVSGESEKPYGSEGLGSKYMDDEGEPSRFWQDERIRRLQEAARRIPLPAAIQQVFLNALQDRDPEVMDRFAQFLDSLPTADITHAREVLDQFADEDTRKQTRAKRWLQFRRWLPVLPLSASISYLLKTPYEWPQFTLWGITALLLPIGVHALFFAKEPRSPFTRRDVEEHFRERG